jgi:hypothetical protein
MEARNEKSKNLSIVETEDLKKSDFNIVLPPGTSLIKSIGIIYFQNVKLAH